MWAAQTDPLGNAWLSALLAAAPILVFLLCLVALRMRGLWAGVIALVVQVVVAAVGFGMPSTAITGAGLLGLLTALWPIAYIIVMAVWLYRLAVASGRFDVIRSSIAGVSPDQRIQVLLISFGFGAFLEGAAGFGVPIAICAALLVQLGFRPVKAAMLSLVANAGAGAYGAIGIPVIVGAQVSGMDVQELSRALVVMLQPLTLLIPFVLVLILDGWRGLRETWPATLLVTVVFSGLQAGVLWFLGPELADLSAGLGAMVAFAAQMSMGSSWRVGVVGGETGDLVSGGLYRFSRNPTFVGQFLLLAGVGLAIPSVPTLLAPMLFLWSAVTQVRSEEAALRQSLGQAYEHYLASVPRWFGLGRRGAS